MSNKDPFVPCQIPARLMAACKQGDECQCSAYDKGVEETRTHIKGIIQDNVPHDGYCSMDDCNGCRLVDELLRKIG